MRTLHGKPESEGFFASFGEAPTTNPKDAPLMALRHLRERLTATNNKDTVHGTKLTAPNGPISSGITKLSNLIHKQVLSDERDVANLEPLKDEFDIGTTAATIPDCSKHS